MKDERFNNLKAHADAQSSAVSRAEREREREREREKEIAFDKRFIGANVQAPVI